MKAPIAVLAFALIASTPATALEEGARPAPWLVAQSDRRMPTCRLDERDVPVGATTCREGYTHVCSPRGGWERTNKPC